MFIGICGKEKYQKYLSKQLLKSLCYIGIVSIITGKRLRNKEIHAR